MVLRKQATASVAVGFGREGAAYVNPYTAQVLGTGSKLHDWFHDVLDWHRWLGRDGEGRATGASHHRRLQSRLFLARRQRSLSLVAAARLALARVETEPCFQFPPARQGAGLELAQRDWLLVIRRAGRAHADRSSDVLPVG